jgi:hypothetical protein
MTKPILPVSLLLFALATLAALPACSKRGDGSSPGNRGLNAMNAAGSAGSSGSPMTMEVEPEVSRPDAPADLEQDKAPPNDARPNDAPLSVPRLVPFVGIQVPIADYDKPGPGPCAAKTYRSLHHYIVGVWPELKNQPGASQHRDGGVVVDGFVDDTGFRFVFDRGTGDCPSGCISHELWYFETDHMCIPHQVGHCMNPPRPDPACEVPAWGRCLMKSTTAATLLPEHDPDHDRYRSGVDMCPLMPEDEVMPNPCDGCPAN